MRLDFLRSVCAQTIDEISIEQLRYQVLGLWSDHASLIADLRPLNPIPTYVVKHFLNGVSPERPHPN